MEGVGGLTPRQTNLALPEPKGAHFENALSTSRSYTKLSVAGKKGASPDAIIWIWSMSGLGKFSVNCSRRNWISTSKTVS